MVPMMWGSPWYPQCLTKRCSYISVFFFFQGIIGSILEVTAMTCLVFLVLTHLPNISAIFAMNGIFVVQALVDVFSVKCCNTSSHDPPKMEQGRKSASKKTRKQTLTGWLNMLLENKLSRIVALFLLICPVLAGSIYIGIIMKEVMLPVTLPLCLLFISAVWSTTWQRIGTEPGAVLVNTGPEQAVFNLGEGLAKPRSRYKSSK